MTQSLKICQFEQVCFNLDIKVSVELQSIFFLHQLGWVWSLGLTVGLPHLSVVLNMDFTASGNQKDIPMLNNLDL